MNFRFSVDDNIWFFQDLAKNNYSSIFENSYLALYKRLHEKYNIKVQLNLFYQFEDFNLSQMPDRYKQEWIANKDWLQLSFHSKTEQTLYTNSIGAVVKTIMLYNTNEEDADVTLSIDSVIFTFKLTTKETKIIDTHIVTNLIKGIGLGVNVHISGLQLEEE